LHVVSVHGSARTAKIKCIREVRRVYRDRILVTMQNNSSSNNNNNNIPQKSTSTTSTSNRRKRDRNDDVDAETVQLCRALEDTLEQIVVIDF